MVVNSRRLFFAVVASVVLVGAATGCAAGGRRPPESAPPPAAVPAPDLAAVAAAEEVPLPAGLAEGWYAYIDTSFGVIVARLLPDQAPQSVAHFAALAEGRLGWPDPLTGETHKTPYYDGLRVTKSIAADRFEMGERTEVGRTTPPFYVPPEGVGPVDYSAPGRLGMIRSVMNRISGVKFFVTAGTLPFLNGLHPCFGLVVSGQWVVAAISEVKTYRNGMPIDPVTVTRIRVRKVGNPPALPEPVEYVPQGDVFGPRIEPRK